MYIGRAHAPEPNPDPTVGDDTLVGDQTMAGPAPEADGDA